MKPKRVVCDPFCPIAFNGVQMETESEIIEYWNPVSRYNLLMELLDIGAISPLYAAIQMGMTIGTGPWPDDQDSGDPPDSEVPSTLPMGALGPRGAVATTAAAVKAMKAVWIGPPFFGGNKTTDNFDIKPPVVETGCNCAKCNEFNEYAEPNQSNGTYVCYRCR